VFRRRRAPADPAVDRVLGAVEQAKEALIASVPSPRGVPRRAVADAVLEFEDGLRRASAELRVWSHAPAAFRRSCADAIDESLRRAERLRLEAPPLDYEGLVSILGDLLAPLEVFADVDRQRRP
jgi:hypothetical protein